MNTKTILAWAAFAVCSVAAIPAIAQQRDVQITMEVLDDVSDIDAVVLELEDERSGSDPGRSGIDANATGRREAADVAEGADPGERGIDASGEQVDEREDADAPRNVERAVEHGSELDASTDDAPDTGR